MTNKNNENRIVVSNLTKEFGKFTAVKDVSFSVKKGSIQGFIGPNGSGKTTIIKSMIGAYIVDDGSILIKGYHAGTANANKQIGYIPERASFPKYMNTLRYLFTMGELAGLKPRDAKKRAKEILEDLNMTKHAKRKPITFSSGMKKKILLAQALLTDPDILILDEPAANLDPIARKELFDTLINLRDQGKTILISSHILSELERIVDEATFIYYGEVIWSGDIKEFLNQETNLFIKTSDNKLAKKVLDEKSYTCEGDVEGEMFIKNLNSEQIQDVYNILGELPLRVIAFRSNDLQSIYQNLVIDSNEKGKGEQKLGKVSTV